MPFLPPIVLGATAATAIGTFIVNTAISVAISYGASLLINKLVGGDQNSRQLPSSDSVVAGGVIETVRFGEKESRKVACGLCATAGRWVYVNTYGNANRIQQRVFVLSDWYTTDLTRVAIDGRYVTLSGSNTGLGYEVDDGPHAGFIRIRFFDGTQTTAASALVNNANPDTRWTEDHIGHGVSFVIVTYTYDQEKMTQIPSTLFEFQGAPLYDWRLDTTAGGSGSHRWNNVNTWEYSANPILMDYCYRRGGFAYDGDIFCGMAMSSSELPLTEYTAAANICDETVSGENRYECSIFLDADREHGANLEDILLSCNGMNVDAVNKHYPIINASQSPVATLTADDLLIGRPVEFDRDGSFADVVNTVSGTYSEPNLLWDSVGYTTVENATGVTLDRRTLDASLSFPMVVSRRQARQLAKIYLYETRWPATKTCTVDPKWQGLRVGDWIDWTDDEDGENRTYQIMAMQVASLDSDNPRAVTLSLRERNENIYDGIAADALSEDVVLADPVYLNEVSNFSVIPVFADTAQGKLPALSASWDSFDDPTVTGVLVQWRVKNGDRIFSKTVPWDQTTVPLQEGIVSNRIYEVRTRILAMPYRATVASAWTEVLTYSGGTVGLGDVGSDVIASFELLKAEIDDLRQLFIEGQALSLTSDFDWITWRASIGKQADATQAQVVTFQTAQATLNASFAADIQTVAAQYDNLSAEGLLAITSEAAPKGAVSRVALSARAKANGNAYEAALFLDAMSTGETRAGLKASQIVFFNDSNVPIGGFINGAFTSPFANLGNVTAGRIRSDDGLWDFNLTAGYLRWNDINFINTKNGKFSSDLIEIIQGNIKKGGGALVKTFVFGGAQKNLRSYKLDFYIVNFNLQVDMTTSFLGGAASLSLEYKAANGKWTEFGSAARQVDDGRIYDNFQISATGMVLASLMNSLQSIRYSFNLPSGGVSRTDLRRWNVVGFEIN